MVNLREQFYKFHWLRSWRPYFILFVLGFLLYSQALFFDLTYLDDNTLLIDNREIISEISNLPLAFSSDAFFSGTNFYYRPILNVSFMIDTFLAGDNFFIYFLINIFLHLIAASLVFLILQKIFNRRPLAFFLSLVFLVHPAISQAVAWLPGRNDSLLAIFVLLSFVFLQKFLNNPRSHFLIFYSLSFFLALLTKETAVFAPLMVVVYLFTIGRKSVAEKHDKALLLIFSFFTGVIWFLMRSLAFGKENISLPDAFQSLGDNLSGAVIMASKLILPFNLSVLPVPIDSSFLWSTLAIPLIVVAIVLSKHKNMNRFWFGLAWFLIFLLPPFVISSAAPYILEHRLYLPMVGFLIMISEIDWIKDLDFSRRKIKIITASILIALALITFFHSQQFKNRLVFWESAVKDSPRSVLAQKNLGAMYYFEGRLDESFQHYYNALKLNPVEPMVNSNLGLIYIEWGNQAEAEKFFRQELALYPNYEKGLLNLGTLYYNQNNFFPAKTLFQRVLQLNPRQIEAAYYLQKIVEQELQPSVKK